MPMSEHIKTRTSNNTKLPTSKFYILILSCSLIILSASLEVMFRVKDVTLFNQWIEQNKFVGDEALLLSQYISLNLTVFFSKIIIPVMFGVYTYFAYIKLRINQLYVFMWTVLNLGGLAYTAIEMNLNSVFYYVSIIGYAVMLITILSLVDVIRENKSK